MTAASGIALAVALVLWGAVMARAETAGPLTLERKISLGDVSGRIDHMGIDLRRNRLLVAELGNGSVGVVDLAQGVVVHRVVGLSGPQGVSYFPDTDTVYVANGGDGMVRLFTAEDMAPIARLALGKDADNIRIDTQAKQILVGYGDGGLAMIDGTTGLQTGTIPLPVHPEGFQLDPQGRRVFVNLADRNEIGVIDRAAKQITGRWSVAGLRSNIPMALDDTGERVFVGFRHPERLAVFDARDGKVLANLDTCGDADDVSYDAKRRRPYVSCGEGAVDVIQQADAGYSRLARVPTERGARTRSSCRNSTGSTSPPAQRDRSRPPSWSSDRRPRSGGSYRSATSSWRRPMTVDRRTMMQGAGLAAGAALAAAILPSGTAQAQSQTPVAKPAVYAPKPLPFDPQKIKGLSEKLLVSHYENNYKGAVTRLNQIADQIASLDYAKTPGYMVNGLKREELIAANSMVIHEVYFASLGDESRPAGALDAAIARDFGSYDRWAAEFAAMGKALGGGSGWVLLTYSPRDKRLINQWASDHTTTLAGGQPVLVLDMYEHAYHMDYGAKAASYVDAFMKAIRWQSADALYDKASKA